ncbi:MAG: YdcF family protein [Azoarcus sp.]|jgi:uncharacterized SAM-binding protein YcdF (DUF218 family)|nr:YdcF family protein [Azoarcus sp.]
MKTTLLIIGIVLFINVFILSFVANFHAGLVVLGLLSVSLILYALFFDKIPGRVHLITVIMCLIPILFMVFLGIYGNASNSTYDENVVIALGAGIRGDQVRGTLARRLDAVVQYHKKNPKAVIIVCGGQGPQETITEALAMERYLVARGVPEDKILKEDKSTTTLENFMFARVILNNHFPHGYTSVLITNDFHIFRSLRLARHAGINPNHFGAPTDWYLMPVNYLREVLAVGKMVIYKNY